MNLESVANTFVLTVAEGKRLIARAVAAMPEICRARENGLIMIGKGTTNAYVVEELLGHPIDKGSYVLGRTVPQHRGSRAENVFGGAMPDVVLRNGEVVEGLSVVDAVQKEAKAGDVVIKGANALDYQKGVAGVLIGHPQGGTFGGIIGAVYGKGLHLVIPVGLEKQIAGDLERISNDIQMVPELVRPHVPGIALMRGLIVTEIEALSMLTGATVLQIGAGGVCGAEGGVWLLASGTLEQVSGVERILETVLGEPEFGTANAER